MRIALEVLPMSSFQMVRALAAVMSLAACSATEPLLDGLVVVSVVTQGQDLPTTPYLLGVDSASARTIAANSITNLSALRSGTRRIILTGLPRNCTEVSGGTRTIQLGEGGREQVSFRVTCTSALANLTVQVDPIGTPTPGVVYTFTLDDGQVLTILPGQTATAQVGHIGARYIGLTNLPRNCHGPSSVGPIRLKPNADTTITVVVTCQLFESGIMYARIRSGDWAHRLYRALPDGSNEFLLGNAWAHHYSPSIAPGGDLIAFTTVRYGVNGQVLATLTPDGVKERFIAGGSGPPGYRRVSDPAWSSDGQRVVAAAGRDGELDRYVIFDMATGAVTDLGYVSRGVMDWDRVSGRIALMRDHLGRSRIWVMDPDGANGTWIADPLGSGMHDRVAAWSPDGRTVAVLRGVQWNWVPNRLDLVTVATGETRTLVLDAPFLAERPAWSPDGRRLLATIYTTDFQSVRVEEIDAMTGTRRVIVPGTPGSPARSPAWR